MEAIMDCTAVNIEEQNKKAMALREELETLGRFGILSWCDGDIEEELTQLNIPVTPELVKHIRELVQIDAV
jgi:hypothetical protein